MILPCEIAVKSIIPAIRAAMAKELVETYNLKQDQVAEILGISQSAVSKYTRKVRGHVIEVYNMQEILPVINRMIASLMNRNPKRSEFLGFFCQACIAIREKGVMCPFCKKTDPKVRMEGCDFCFENTRLQNEEAGGRAV